MTETVMCVVFMCCGLLFFVLCIACKYEYVVEDSEAHLTCEYFWYPKFSTWRDLSLGL